MHNDTPQHPPELQHILSRLKALYQDNLSQLNQLKPDFATRSAILKQWYAREVQGAISGFYKAKERLNNQEIEARDNFDVRALLEARREFQKRLKDILGEAGQAVPNE